MLKHLFALSLFITPLAVAQDLSTLEVFSGTWEGEVEMEEGGMKFAGFVTFEWAPTKKAMRSTMTMVINGANVPGSEGLVGWHPTKKKFTWVDISGDGSWSEGTLEKTGENTWYYQWETTTPAGQTTRLKQDLTFIDADSYKWRVYVDQGGTWAPFMKEAVFKRKK